MLPPRRKAPNISTKPQPLRLTFEERLIMERIDKIRMEFELKKQSILKKLKQNRK